MILVVHLLEHALVELLCVRELLSQWVIVLVQHLRLVLQDGQVVHIVFTVVIVYFGRSLLGVVGFPLAAGFDCVLGHLVALGDQLLVLPQLSILEIVRCRVRDVLNRRWVELLRHDVERVPDLKVVALLEGVELVVVCSSICIDLRLLVGSQDAPHGPFAVHEATIPNYQKLRSSAAWAAEHARQVFLELKDVVAAIDND